MQVFRCPSGGGVRCQGWRKLLYMKQKKKSNMKKVVFLTGVIFMILAMPVRAQVYEMHYQGFEAGESPNYRVTPDGGAVYSTTVYSSGDRSIQSVRTAFR